MNNSIFTTSTYRFLLNGQPRLEDKEYVKILDHIRNWRLHQNILNQIQEGRVICEEEEIIPAKLVATLIENTETTVLTFTNEAVEYINNVISSSSINRNI